MKITSKKTYALACAVALGMAVANSSGAYAQSQILDGEDIGVEATVENTITVAITDINFGTIGAVKHDTTSATITIDTTGTVTDDVGQGYGSARPASVVHDTTAGGEAAGEIDITGGIDGADFFITYTDFVNPTNGTDSFLLTDVNDDCDTTNGASAAGVVPVVAPDVICQTTTAGGAVTVNVGAGLTTEVAAGPDAALGEAYTDGVYTGQFTAYISY